MALLWLPVALTVLAGAAAYFYFTRNFDYWKKRGVTFLRPTVGVGNLGPVFRMKRSYTEHLKHIYRQCDEPYFGIFYFNKPTLVIKDLDLIKAVFVSDFASFPNRIFNINDYHEKLMSLSLFGLRDDKWKSSRLKLTPSFTPAKLRQQYVIVHECVQELEAALERESHQPIYVQSLFARYNMDAIMSTAFGTSGNALQNPDCYVHNKLIQMFNTGPVQGLKFLTCFVAPHIVNKYQLNVMDPEIFKIIRNIIGMSILERHGNKVRRNDFLDTLIEWRDRSTEEAKVDEIVSGIDVADSKAYL